MRSDKVVYLDDYRKKRYATSRNLFAVIEGHLAEAGLWTNTPFPLEKCLDENYAVEPEHLRMVRRELDREKPGDTA